VEELIIQARIQVDISEWCDGSQTLPAKAGQWVWPHQGNVLPTVKA